MRTSLILFTALIILPMICQAMPTGLLTIPTADVLEPLAVRIDAEFNGSGKLYATPSSDVYGVAVGLPLGVEVGADHVTKVERTTLLNAKWQFKGDGLILPALTVGVQNVSQDVTPQFYAVATKYAPFHIASGTAGVLRDTNGDLVLLLGAGAKFGPILAQVDKTIGSRDDHTAIGGGFAFSHFSIKGATIDFQHARNVKTITVSYQIGEG